MDKEQEEYLKLILAIIDWFNQPEKVEIIDEDIIKKCKESKLPERKDFIFGGDAMKSKIEIILNYNFDPEQGYTQKSIELDSNEWCIYENQLTRERKVMVNLYEEDIEELVKGTGIDLDVD